jgi:hypothetical protein
MTPLLSVGQPIGGIVQVSYTVAEIETAMRHYLDNLRLGPWFVRGPFTPKAAQYRGQPTTPTLSLALTFSGHLMVELVQQHDDGPSVYRETIARTGGHGFHHWGVASTNFDADAAGYRARGYEQVFYDVTPVGTRVAYFDTTANLPGMIELIEMTEAQDRRYARMYAETLAWDGSEPIRRLG